MTVDQLREFLVLSEIGNYQKAADVLYISQATLSRHIMNLENELGITLFDRLAHTNKLSAAGKQFLPHAKNIVDLADGSFQRIQQKLHHEEGDLSIAVLRNFTYYKVSDLLIDFNLAHPHITININETSSSAMKRMLTEGQCSFSFVSEMGNAENDSFLREPFCTDVLTVCLPAAHPLAGSKSITLDQLKDENLVMAPQRGSLYDSLMLACRRSGFEPRIAHLVSGNSIYRFVGNGLCVAILLKTPALSAHLENTCLVDLSPPISVYINIIYPQKQLTAEETCFLNFARSYASSLKSK